MSLVAFLAAFGTFALFGFLFPPVPVEGTVRRGRFAGILRIFPGSHFQLFKTLTVGPKLFFLSGEACRHFGEHALQIKNVMPHGFRGQVPFQLAERSFGFHENEAIIGESKNLDFFAILSATYNVLFCCVILMSYIIPSGACIPCERLLKINEDFEGAKEHWEEYFDEWVFVHNTHDGRLSPNIIEKLEKLKLENPGIKIGHWGYEELLIEFRKLDIVALESWFGMSFDMQTSANLGYEELQAVLQHIQVTTSTDPNDIREVSRGKIEANLLSTAVSDFLKIGMQKYRLVEGFFRNWRDPNYEGQLATAFKNKYLDLKGHVPALHPDLIFAKLEEWAGGSMTTTPSKKVAVLTILAYFFDKCVVFEDAESR